MAASKAASGHSDDATNALTTASARMNPATNSAVRSARQGYTGATAQGTPAKYKQTVRVALGVINTQKHWHAEQQTHRNTYNFEPTAALSDESKDAFTA